MIITFNKLSEINQRIFRNIRGKLLDFDEFDDLTTDPNAKAFAHRSSALNSSSSNTLSYDAIDYIFEKKTWEPTRFGDGQYPVWYGSLDLITSFHETIHQWQKTYINAPRDFNRSKQVIPAVRTVFTVTCKAALIDLRDYANELTHTNPALYTNTQQIGFRIHQEGYPGLLTKSARINNGENAAIFRKEVLFDPEHYNNYKYEYDLINRKITVKDFKGHEISLSN